MNKKLKKLTPACTGICDSIANNRNDIAKGDIRHTGPGNYYGGSEQKYGQWLYRQVMVRMNVGFFNVLPEG